MNNIKIKLKAICLSFFDGVVPSLILIGLFALVYLFYSKVYSGLMLDTLNVFSIIGTILMLPAGIFAIICFLVVSYSFFHIGLNQALITFSFGNRGGFSIYESGGRFVLDKGNIAIGQVLLGMLLFVLIVPFSLLLWLIRVIRILFSKSYAEAMINVSGEGFSFILIPSLIGVGACVFGLLVFGLKGIQDAFYNPYKPEPYITQLTFSGTNYIAHLSFDLNVDSFDKANQINGDVIIKYPNSDKEYIFRDRYITDGKYYLPGFNLTFDTSTEKFKEMYEIGFDNLSYYFKIKSVSFDIGTSRPLSNRTIRLDSREYEYTSKATYVFY